ncbi:MAG: molybdenum ABC transporter ATP-binding protein [Rhizobiaceae bacterium]|nr:molybdenum ABC transporter ATP-binding protein [Rhizobiaceae bacterium]
MSLSVDVHHRLGSFEIEAAFESSGRLTALFGPSGSGKSTLVNLIAGLMRPDRGYVTFGDRTLVDTGQRIFLPPYRRRIGYVFQDARLFPHFTVSQNLRYGRFFTPAAKRYADFDHVVELLGLGNLLERRPSLLSGGEKQRVAIGRALIASPRLILMDEPLASLDDARKAEILPYIERLRDESRIPIVYVSHSLAEVTRLATDVVVMSAGRVAAAGPAVAVLSRMDLLPDEDRDEAGTLIEFAVTGHEDEFGLTVLHSQGGEWRVPRIEVSAGGSVRARVRARDVMIATEEPRGISALNVLPGLVAEVSAGERSDALVAIDCGGDRILARVTRRSLAGLGLEPGRRVFAVVKAVAFDKGSTARRAPPGSVAAGEGR